MADIVDLLNTNPVSLEVIKDNESTKNHTKYFKTNINILNTTQIL